ncbi:unnamed protein product [Closterium sp. Naga37s-1]|nr:unnamed protein product [Closterium sp. Naga37s-1]
MARVSEKCLATLLLVTVVSLLCVTQVASAYTGYERLVAKLTESKKYSIALAAWRLSGLNNTLRQLLPTSKMTFLVPENAAFDKLPGNFRYSKIRHYPKVLRQIMSYHIWRQRFSIDDLSGLRTGTQFPTLDYSYVMEMTDFKPCLNNTLKQWLPTSQMTILVPRNSAFSKLTGSFSYSKLKKNPKALLQVMAFHVWKQRFSNTTLQAIKVGTQVMAFHVFKQRFSNTTLQAIKVGTQFATLDYKYVIRKAGTKKGASEGPV